MLISELPPCVSIAFKVGLSDCLLVCGGTAIVGAAVVVDETVNIEDGWRCVMRDAEEGKGHVNDGDSQLRLLFSSGLVDKS